MDAPLSSPSPGVGVDVAGWLGEGWRIFRGSPARFVLSTAIIAVVLATAYKIPILLFLAFRPLALGFYLVAADADAGRPFSPTRIFNGFAWFLPCVAAEIFVSAFSGLGMIFLVLPGLIISSWYIFTWLFIADRGMGFWEAMEASRRLTGGDRTGFFLFYMALVVLNLFGALCLLAGLFVTVPVTAISLFAAYKKTAGLKTLGPVADGIIDR